MLALQSRAQNTRGTCIRAWPRYTRPSTCISLLCLVTRLLTKREFFPPSEQDVELAAASWPALLAGLPWRLGQPPSDCRFSGLVTLVLPPSIAAWAAAHSRDRSFDRGNSPRKGRFDDGQGVQGNVKANYWSQCRFSRRRRRPFVVHLHRRVLLRRGHPSRRHSAHPAAAGERRRPRRRARTDRWCRAGGRGRPRPTPRRLDDPSHDPPARSAPRDVRSPADADRSPSGGCPCSASAPACSCST